MSTWLRKAIAGERWTKLEGVAAIGAWRASGESMAAFAERHEIDPQRIGWWRKRLEAGAADVPTTLVPVTIAAPRVLIGTAAVRVQSAHVEIAVHDPERVSPEWVAALMTMIGKAAR